MPIYLSIFLIIIAAIVLIHAVKLFISSSSKLAKELKISTYTVSFLIVAIATSLPEMVVGVTSAFGGNPTLSLGNVIGSNIALITLVLALPVLFNTEKGISTRTILHSKDAYYSMFVSLIPILLIVDGELTRLDGGLLILGYLFYSFIVWRRSSPIEQILQQFENVNIWKEIVYFVFSLILLLAASEVIVRSSVELSLALGWGLTFVGLTIVAIGTSLPEISFTLGTSSGRFQQQVLGNIVGSVVANASIVLGITSLIKPIVVTNGDLGFSSLLLLTLITLVFLRFVKTREKIDKLEAVLLLGLYFAFIVVEYAIQTYGIKIFG